MFTHSIFRLCKHCQSVCKGRDRHLKAHQVQLQHQLRLQKPRDIVRQAKGLSISRPYLRNADYIIIWPR